MHQVPRTGLVACMPLALLVACGCAQHKQVQHYRTWDPNTGARAYYRLTVEGGSAPAQKYHLQAGYFNSASVDILRGEMPETPVLNLPIEQLDTHDDLIARMDGMLRQQARRLAPITNTAILYEYRQQRQRDAGRAQVVAVAAEAAATTDFQAAKEAHTSSEERLKNDSEQLKQRTVEVAESQRTLDALSAELADRTDVYYKAKAEYDNAGGAAATQPVRQKRDDAEKALDDAKKNFHEARIKHGQAEEAQRSAQSAHDSSVASCREAAKRLRVEEARQARTKADAETARLRLTAADAAVNYLEQKHPDEIVPGLETEERPPLRADQFEKQFLQMAKLVWCASLSRGDRASIGMAQTMDPFQFRKLVFWVSAEDIDLRSLSQEIDQIFEGAVAVAESFKTLARQRREERQQQTKGEKQRSQCALQALQHLNLTDEQKELVKNLFGTCSPAVAAQQAPSSGAAQ